MRIFKKILLYISIFLVISGSYSVFKVYKAASKSCMRNMSEKYEQKRKEYAKYIEDKYKPEKISFSSSDNIDLSGLLFIRPAAKRIILMCHGYRQAKEFLAPLIDLFESDSLFLFDFRAHGDSGGDKVSFGNLESYDIKAALDIIKKDKRLYNLPIYAIGLSMGAVAIVKAVYEGSKFNGLVLDSGYAVLKDQAEISLKNLTGLPTGAVKFGQCIYELIFGASFRNLNTGFLITSIKTPVLIIHSADDKTTPIYNAYDLFNRAGGKKELWVVKDAPHIHNHIAYPEEYKQRVDSFFDALEKESKTIK